MGSVGPIVIAGYYYSSIPLGLNALGGYRSIVVPDITIPEYSLGLLLGGIGPV